MNQIFKYSAEKAQNCKVLPKIECETKNNYTAVKENCIDGIPIFVHIWLTMVPYQALWEVA